MKSKLILATFCAALLSSSVVHGHNCPTIPEKWDGKTLEASGPLTWSVGKITSDVDLAKVSWKPNQAWILPENTKKHAKDGYFKCTYKAVDKENKVIGKLTVVTPVTPELQKLAATSEFKGEDEKADKKTVTVDNDYANKDGTVKGAKCTLKKGDETFNKFPAACEIVAKPANKK
jgi:hypothetical protein